MPLSTTNAEPRVPSPDSVRKPLLERVAGFRIPAVHPALEPLDALLRRAVREALGRHASAELYLSPVGISGRPSLILCSVVDRPTLEITRRANDLTRAAGLSLERILVSKKRAAGPKGQRGE